MKLAVAEGRFASCPCLHEVGEGGRYVSHPKYIRGSGWLALVLGLVCSYACDVAKKAAGASMAAFLLYNYVSVILRLSGLAELQRFLL